MGQSPLARCCGRARGNWRLWGASGPVAGFAALLGTSFVALAGELVSYTGRQFAAPGEGLEDALDLGRVRHGFTYPQIVPRGPGTTLPQSLASSVSASSLVWKYPGEPS